MLRLIVLIFDRQGANIVVAYSTAFDSEVFGDRAVAYYGVGDVQVETATAV